MKYLDVVATTEAMPDERLEKGQVGTVVEVLDGDVALVEFSDMEGVAYALAPIPVGKLMVLKQGPSSAVYASGTRGHSV